MQTKRIDQEQIDSEMYVKARLDFAQRIYTSGQELNRNIDFKANFLITAVGILTTALGVVAGAALNINMQPQIPWPDLLRTVGAVSILAFLLMAFTVTYTATRVYQALPNMLHPDSESPGLMFPLTVLRRFQVDGNISEEKYLDRLSRATPQELLYDYSNQILEISNIYRYKQAQINLSIRRFQWLSILWIVSMLVMVLIIVLSHK